MAFKNVEYTKLEIEKDDDYNSGFRSQPFNERDEFIGEVRDTDRDRHDHESDERPGLWSFRYYQTLFDIDTRDVVRRVAMSFLPVNPRASFVKSVMNRKPDLYGPFWTCTSLVLTIAIAGNIANYFQFDDRQRYFWRYEFRKLSLAAISIYSYWWIMPLIVWGIARSRNIRESSFLELLTLFGYSLFIYIPISIFWVVQVSWFQWLLVIVALVLSGFVLVSSVWADYSPINRQLSLGLVTVVAAMHTLLAVGFMLYFFHVPSNGNSSLTVPAGVKAEVTNSKFPKSM